MSEGARWSSVVLCLALGMGASPQIPPSGLRTLPMDSALVNGLLRFEIPTPYAYQRLGLFYKLDVQLEKRLPLPVRFRLGDPLHVDALEGKGPLRTMPVDP